jgi:hypothetical protein
MHQTGQQGQVIIHSVIIALFNDAVSTADEEDHDGFWKVVKTYVEIQQNLFAYNEKNHQNTQSGPNLTEILTHYLTNTSYRNSGI